MLPNGLEFHAPRKRAYDKTEIPGEGAGATIGTTSRNDKRPGGNVMPPLQTTERTTREARDHADTLRRELLEG
jgi:hypothetical protein